MLKGSKVGLRARHTDDLPILRAELYDDVVSSSRAESGPWRPIPPGTKDPRLVVDDRARGHVPERQGAADSLLGDVITHRARVREGVIGSAFVTQRRRALDRAWPRDEGFGVRGAR